MQPDLNVQCGLHPYVRVTAALLEDFIRGYTRASSESLHDNTLGAYASKTL